MNPIILGAPPAPPLSAAQLEEKVAEFMMIVPCSHSTATACCTQARGDVAVAVELFYSLPQYAEAVAALENAAPPATPQRSFGSAAVATSASAAIGGGIHGHGKGTQGSPIVLDSDDEEEIQQAVIEVQDENSIVQIDDASNGVAMALQFEQQHQHQAADDVGNNAHVPASEEHEEGGVAHKLHGTTGAQDVAGLHLSTDVVENGNALDGEDEPENDTTNNNPTVLDEADEVLLQLIEGQMLSSKRKRSDDEALVYVDTSTTTEDNTADEPNVHPFFTQFGKKKEPANAAQLTQVAPTAAQTSVASTVAAPPPPPQLQQFNNHHVQSQHEVPTPLQQLASGAGVSPHPALRAKRQQQQTLPLIPPPVSHSVHQGHPREVGCATFNLTPCVPEAATKLLNGAADYSRLEDKHYLHHRPVYTRKVERVGALLWLLCPRCFGEQVAGGVLYDAVQILVTHKCMEPAAFCHPTYTGAGTFDDPYGFETQRYVAPARKDEFTKTFAGPIRAFQRLMHGIDDPQQEVPKCHEGCKHLQLYRLLDNLDFIPFTLRGFGENMPNAVHFDLFTIGTTLSMSAAQLPTIGAASCHARIAMSSLFDVFGLPGHGTYSGNSLACEDPSNNVDVIASYPEAHHSQVVQMHEATKDYTTHERLLRAVSINEKEDKEANAPRVATPDGLRGRLRPHQEESLAFMLERERNGTRDFVQIVTETLGRRVFTIYFAPSAMQYYVVEKSSLDAECKEQMRINPLIRGGILADEVGLGKTVSLMALMVANPAPHLNVNLNTTSVPIKATLVVGTVSICKQWVAELKRFLPHATCLMWHGSSRTSKRMMHLAAADLVVTTYETLKSDFSHRRAPLVNARFHRVIFDECQKLAGGTLNHLDIQADHRWAVSATPINKNYVALAPIAQLLGCKAFEKKVFTPMDKISKPERPYMFLVDERDRVRLYRWIPNDAKSTNTIHSWLAWGSKLKERSPTVAEALVESMCGQQTMESAEYYVKDNEAFTHIARGEFQKEYIIDDMFKINRWIVPYFLSRYMIRHVKSDDLLNNLNLPPVHYQHHRVELTEAELKDYTEYVNTIRPTFRTWSHRDKIGENISRIMMWVDNIRRAASSVDLFSVDVRAEFEHDRGRAAPAAAALPAGAMAAQDAENQRHNITKIRTAELQAKLVAAGSALPASCEEIFAGFLETPPVVSECAVCMDVIQDPLMLSCFHFFCRECMLGVLNAAGGVGGKCPQCRSDTSNKAKYLVDLAPPPPPVVDEPKVEPEVKKAAVEDPDAGVCSKVRAIVRTISEISGEDPESKFVIFTHFSGMIGMIQGALQRGGVRAAVIDGSTTLQQRGNIIQGFQGELEANNASRAAKEKFGNLRAVIVSSRAGNAGITLTAANHLILADASIDVVMETQALGRIHRIGQQRPVTIHKFNSANTIEERIAFLFNRGKLSGQGSKNAGNAGTTGAGGGSAMIEQMKYFFMDDAEAVAHEAALGPEVPQGGGGGGGPAAPNEP